MSGLTFDAGALIAFERADRAILKAIARVNATGGRVSVPSGVVGQVWRDGRTQARLAALLRAKFVELVVLDTATARAAGELCGRAGADDVIDASVVLCARKRGHGVATSDPEDLARLDPNLRLVVV
jgi:hypothetical protein